ncbi:MAG: HPF/RaiA family ribosome-associated protein [Gammaproteobacteria bacterium]|jgi:ribosome-associated translation inhibitor RaiA/cold shock CspA family protein
MKLPLEVVFRNLPPSDAIEAKVRERAAKLDVLFPDIMSCRVVVEADHKHHYKGNLYHIGIDITLPGAELVANREPHNNHAHEDVYVAIRDAFDAMRRQLEDYTRRRRRDVKAHTPPPHGHIVELQTDEGYGRIETSDGRTVYFHRNSVLNGDFSQLKVGDSVRFTEEMGELGPQASTVHVEGKHHVVS